MTKSKDPITLSVAGKVRAITGEADMTNVELSELLGCSRMTVQRRLAAEYPFPVVELVKIARATQTPMSAFFADLE